MQRQCDDRHYIIINKGNLRFLDLLLCTYLYNYYTRGKEPLNKKHRDIKCKKFSDTKVIGYALVNTSYNNKIYKTLIVNTLFHTPITTRLYLGAYKVSCPLHAFKSRACLFLVINKRGADSYAMGTSSCGCRGGGRDCFKSYTLCKTIFTLYITIY